MPDRSADALEAMNEAVLAIAAERSVERVLERIVEVARGLGRARYAALGIPDGEGGFAQFITAGMTEEEVAAMGPLPRTHGLLGAMLESEELAAHARHHPRSALPRLVAADPPPHGLLPGRPDRLARGHHRRLLPHRQGGRGRVHATRTST